MPVKEADPGAAGLDAAFAEAMGAPARPREAPAPPEIDADAPHGRGDDGKPLAPHGYTRDGKVRRSAAGRKPRDEQARTGAAAQPPAGAAAAAAEPQDYSAALAEFADAAWFGATALGKGGSAIPLAGRFIPEQKLSAQAAVFRAHKGALVGAVNLAAQHNARAAKFAASIQGGDATWVLMAGFMIMPCVMMSAAVWKGDEALKEMELPSLKGLADRNDADIGEFMAGMSAQLDIVTAEAAASLNGCQPAGEAT